MSSPVPRATHERKEKLYIYYFSVEIWNRKKRKSKKKHKPKRKKKIQYKDGWSIFVRKDEMKRVETILSTSFPCQKKIK